MALKVVQSLTSGIATGISTSNPIELNTGYLRLTPTALCCIKTGGNPVATGDDFYLPANTSEIIKERVAKQKIVGITTGSSTIIDLGHNNGNPFLVGDYVTIGGSVGINTTHNLVTAVSESYSKSTITINYDSSAVGVVTVTNAYVARSVKVSAFGAGSGLLYISEVQIASQA